MPSLTGEAEVLAVGKTEALENVIVVVGELRRGSPPSSAKISEGAVSLPMRIAVWPPLWD